MWGHVRVNAVLLVQIEDLHKDWVFDRVTQPGNLIVRLDLEPNAQQVQTELKTSSSTD